MTGGLLLIFLLSAAFIGGLLSSGRAIRGYGLPSGAEWLVLGVLLGPHGLELFDSTTIREFQPLVLVGLGWAALVIGIDYGYVGKRRISRKGLMLGLASSALSCAVIGGATFWYCAHQLGFGAKEAATAALGLALVNSETTRHAVRWICELHGADGPLSTFLAEAADADDAIPLLGLAVLISLTTTPTLSVAIDVEARLFITVAVGVVLGLLAVCVLPSVPSLGHRWTVLIGMAMFGIGASMRLGVCSLTAMFIAGVVTSFSRHQEELRALLGPTERPVTLPILLLGGASLGLSGSIAEGAQLLLFALAWRIVAKLSSGWLLSIWVPAARNARSATGSALLASGTLTMSIGLYGYLLVDGVLGEWLLLGAALSTLVGEVVGPLALKRALTSAGEILTPTATRGKELGSPVANRGEQ